MTSSVAAGKAFAVGVVAAAVAGCGSSHNAATCNAGQIGMSVGPFVSEATGQHSLQIELVNHGSACSLKGYPTIQLIDPRGHALGFTYSHKGDQMIPAASPKRVELTKNKPAYFELNKYRCDIQATDGAASIRVTLPGSTTATKVGFPKGTRSIDYCHEAPSLTVDVSPIRLGPHL
jgi:hypothetical protein